MLSNEWRIHQTHACCRYYSSRNSSICCYDNCTGGNEGDIGIPVFLKRKLFVVFFISNALSMIFSTVTLLMFLSVQTSRYKEKEFLETFPNILPIGLIFVFIAVAAMMIAFGTEIGIIIHTKHHRASIPIAAVACFPALIFFEVTTSFDLPSNYVYIWTWHVSGTERSRASVPQ